MDLFADVLGAFGLLFINTYTLLLPKHLFVACNFYFQFLQVRWVNVDGLFCVTKTECNAKCQEFIILNATHYFPEDKAKKKKHLIPAHCV